MLRELGEWYQVHRPVARFPRAAAVFFTGKLSDCGGQAVIGGLCDVCSAVEADRGCYDGPTDLPSDGGSLMSYCANRVFSLGEAGRYGDRSERVLRRIGSLVAEVAPSCLVRTNDPYELQGAVAGRTVTLAWRDLFQGEKRWEVEQRQRNGKLRLVRALPANATGVSLPGQKPGPTAFRVRAQVGRDLAEHSAVVGITIP